MVVDANMYWVPEGLFSDDEALGSFVDEAPQDERTRVYLKEADGVRQVVVEKPTGYEALNYAQGDYVLDTMLSDMDEAGVDVAVLKVPGANEWMGLDTCRMFNDGMADYARRSGGRMVPLAVVPPFAGDQATAEIDRCMGELGFAGVQLCSHYGDAYLDDPAFDPLFQALDRNEATVYVHHVPVPVDYGSIVDYNNLRRSYGRVQDQVTAVGRELFSDFFERYPHIRMVHSMLGGAFFAVSEMLLPRQSKRADAVQRFQTDDGSLARRLHDHVFFEMSHAQPWGTAQLRCAIEVLGADHVVFGTSYPVRREWLLDGPGFVRDLGLSRRDEELVLGGNAQELYRIGREA